MVGIEKNFYIFFEYTFYFLYFYLFFPQLCGCYLKFLQLQLKRPSSLHINDLEFNNENYFLKM